MKLRQAIPEDLREIEQITRLAFWNLHGPGCDEHYLVHTMRHHPDFMKELEWVATIDHQIVGHIAYTKAQVVSDDNTHHQVLCFGPVSVAPDYQHRGIGRALIRHTLELASKITGAPAVLIYGDPQYYSRLGFLPAAYYDIASGSNFYADPLQAFELKAGALCGITGRFLESPLFEMDPQMAGAFDQTFEPLEKLEGTPSQLRFQTLIKLRQPRPKVQERLEALRASAPKIARISPRDSQGDHLVVNLHWKDDTLDKYMPYFEPAYQTLGIEGLFLQSSQRESAKGYCWNDEAQGRLEVLSLLEAENLYAKGQVSKRIKAISGTSQGGRLALQVAMEFGIDYIGVMPAIRDSEVAINTAIQYVFLIGDRDYFYDSVLKLHQNILEAGGQSRLIKIPNTGHYFGPDFTGYYLSAHPITYTHTGTRPYWHQIAKWHNETPRLWMPDYWPTGADIQKTLAKLEATPSEDLFLEVALKGQRIVGFIWAYRQIDQPSHVMILSLYVDFPYRQQGISTQLKKHLETWALKAGVETIETTVHAKNHKMLALNEKLGYEAGMVTMRKQVRKE